MYQPLATFCCTPCHAHC